MQRNLLSALLLMAVFGMSAKHVTPEEALSRIALSNGSCAAKARMAGKLTCTKTLSSNQNIDALYIFQGANTTFFLPADDRVTPILGYLDSPAEGEMPEQLKWWLDEYVSQIEYLQSQTDDSSSAHRAADVATRVAIEPMITTKWGQDAPYNLATPTINGANAATGCVATAAAQLMKYYNYPQGDLSGTISYTDYGTDTTNGTERSLTLDGYRFDWSNMTDTYSSNKYTDDEADAVAFLMKACGYASQTDYYSASSAGGYHQLMMAGMKEYFGYNKDASILLRNTMDSATWEDLIYQHLKNVGPVVYQGRDTSNYGHVFLCDGYSSDGYFHFNWGWNGNYNGYFRTTALIPYNQGIGGVTVKDYNYNQSAIFNLVPTGHTTMEVPTASPFIINGNIMGEYMSFPAYNKQYLLFYTEKSYNSNFQYNFFYNYTADDITGDFGLKVINDQNEVSYQFKSYYTHTTEKPFKFNYGYPEVDYLVTFEKSGTYRVSLVFRKDETEDWVEFAHWLNTTDYLIVTVDDDLNITSVTTPIIGSYSVDGIKVTTPLYRSKAFKYSYTVNNSNATSVIDTLIPYICVKNTDDTTTDETNTDETTTDESEESSAENVRANAASTTATTVYTDAEGNSYTPIATGSSVVVNVAANSTFTDEAFSYMTMASGYESYAGDAYLCLVSANDNSVVGVTDITVNTYDRELWFRVPTFKLVTTDNTVDFNNLVFDCEVTCLDGYYADKIFVAITTGEKTSNGKEKVVASIYAPDVYVISNGETVKFQIAGAFTSAEENVAYNAKLCYIWDSTASRAFEVSSIPLKITSVVAGVDAVADDITATSIKADRAADLITVSAPSEIESVSVYSLDGREIAPEKQIYGQSATIEMAKLPAGVNIVKVILSDGNSTVSKIIK